MKILKKGKFIPTIKKIYKATCPICECEFEFEDKEIIRGFGDDYIICPNKQCKHKIYDTDYFYDRQVKIY